MANVEDMAEIIIQELTDYSKDVEDIMKSEIEKLGKDTVDNLKNNSNIPIKSGKYKKSFYLKKTADGLGYCRFVAANRKYQLTHLLEYGHAKRNGGRTKAYPHWQQAHELAEELPDRIAERLGRL